MGTGRDRGAAVRGRALIRAVAAAAGLAAALAALAGKKTDVTIVPGSKLISASEAAIAADPSHGMQHGVVLLEETERDESLGTGYALTYHLRAKILSPEGRSLADVLVPVERGASELKTWWGRTLLPDGQVLELPQSDLIVQQAAKTVFGTTKVLKAALPGVVPGAVIDYGFTVRGEGYYPYTVVALEREWPVKALRYRWAPSRLMPAAYTSSHLEGKAVKVERDSDSVLVSGYDFVPVLEEPDMPPGGEVRASITFYYGSEESVEDYWNLEAKRAQTRIKLFATTGPIKEAIDEMQIPAGATLDAKLKTAYDWIGAHVKNTWLRTAEEEERGVLDDDEKTADDARAILGAHEGTGRQLDMLFIGMARALGAEATLIYAPDRTERFWQIGLKSMEQFGYTFAAVRPMGAGDDAWTIVDPGSGLPYGDLPWRATGATGFLCLPKGKGSFVIPVSSPTRNRADTHVTISFSDENDSMLAKWSRTGQGSSGMGTRRWLRQLDPDVRKKRLDELCGGIGSTEVVAAELPGLDEPTASYQIACDLEIPDTSIDEGTTSYALQVLGPWWPETPAFTAPTRTLPVIFDYPKVDILGIDVEAPHGFTAGTLPAPVKIESPFGRYEFVTQKTEKGVRVDRAFALFPLMVKAAEYDALKDFLQKVGNADHTRVPFKRAGGAP